MHIIFDLDGTLFDCEHRVHFVKSKPKNYPAFYAGILNDAPIRPMIDVCNKYRADDQHMVTFLTGREETHRKDTLIQLNNHLALPVSSIELYMRPLKDYRPDYEVKEEIYRKNWLEAQGVDMVFEDRRGVVDMWRRNGVLCCQVADGEF